MSKRRTRGAFEKLMGDVSQGKEATLSSSEPKPEAEKQKAAALTKEAPAPKAQEKAELIDRLRKGKKKPPEYASVKLRKELYERLDSYCKSRGVKQTGKAINAIVEDFLETVEE